MTKALDPEESPSIRFEGELLPQSVNDISILIGRAFTKRTSEWIWLLPHCHEVWKGGEAEWCIASATEIIDHLLEHRAEVMNEIHERLGPHRCDGSATIDEWLAALERIRCLAQASDGVCRWIAGEPTERAEETRRRIIAFLDKHGASDG